MMVMFDLHRYGEQRTGKTRRRRRIGGSLPEGKANSRPLPVSSDKKTLNDDLISAHE